MFCDTLLLFDHIFQTVKVVSHVLVPDSQSSASSTDLSNLYSEACDKISKLIAKVSRAETPLPVQKRITLGRQHTSNVGKEGYEGFVTKLKEHILKGNIIQAVPSQRLTRPTDLHPFNVYRHLRQVNPSPYMFYLNCGDVQLIGASPETLCKVENRKVFNHAIAGTVKRGKTPAGKFEIIRLDSFSRQRISLQPMDRVVIFLRLFFLTRTEDQRLGEELQSSAKDRAEHIMLVDLARNDVNRVCKPETVQVDSLMNLEKFSHVIHLTSQISGELRDDKTR